MVSSRNFLPALPIPTVANILCNELDTISTGNGSLSVLETADLECASTIQNCTAHTVSVTINNLVGPSFQDASC
jgi:hypothetical protein